jgi:DNA-binding transcriptional regulator YiaG
MPDIATVLKEEIRRLARKEIKAQIAQIHRAAVQHRLEIAGLKRQLKAQERKIARLEERGLARPEPSATNGENGNGTRFSSRSVRSQRKRLKLSAQQYGKLIGVTAQAIYNWEQRKTRPRKSQMAALVQLRSIGRRAALERLQAAP